MSVTMRRRPRPPALARGVGPGHVVGPHRPGLRGVVSLYARLTRRTAGMIALVVVGYVALEIASFRTAYPDGVSPLQFEIFRDNPAVRMMSGVPEALDTAGGFMVWDAGWLLQVIVAVWAVLTTSRVLRGEEDVDRSDLVLASPVRPDAVTGAIVVVVAAEALVIGAAATLTLGLAGEAWPGAVLFGGGLFGVGATFVGLTAVVSQLVDVRRRVVGVAVVSMGAAYALRMLATSSDSRLALRWLTPLGWIDELKPFGANVAVALLPLLGVPVVLVVVAVRLRAARDAGGALLAPESGGRSRLRLLSSPIAFAWRSTRASLLGWAAGLAAFAAVMGALVATMIDWISGDPGYQRILADLGLDEALTIKGFVAMLSLVLCLAIAVQVISRIGVARTEEEAARLEALLARRVGRLRWLGGHVLLAAVGAVLLAVVVGVGMWAGARAAGSSALTLSDTVTANLNTLPVVALVAGLSIGLFGTVPRLTVTVPSAVVMAGFVLYLLGPALEWPAWALNLSPFTHVAMVPAQRWQSTSGLVMTAIGGVLAAVGMLCFRRRDVGAG